MRSLEKRGRVEALLVVKQVEAGQEISYYIAFH
jgi:hypothetical protein